MQPLLRIKLWNVRKELCLLYFAFKDYRTPFYAKIPAIAGLLYLISPIDFIPDFIPVIGYLDDIIIVPFLLNTSIRLLSKNVMESSQIKADQYYRKMNLLFYLLILLVAILLISTFLLITHIKLTEGRLFSFETAILIKIQIKSMI
jgi:uncharacterized membrane protein YkvA (DUF1232 family)